jgi:hypothetical protein
MTISQYSPSSSSDSRWAFPSPGSLPGNVDDSCEDLQRIWFHAQDRDWRTLALVPGDEQTSTFEVANLIARLAFEQGEMVQVADLRELRLKHVEAFFSAIRWDADRGDRTILAMKATSANVATVPLARAADCAILCVSLGLTSLDSARHAVEQIGREHFLGSVLLKARP